jgi:hypothetical protein
MQVRARSMTAGNGILGGLETCRCSEQLPARPPFEAAPDEYYTGINAAAKSVFLGSPADLGDLLRRHDAEGSGGIRRSG